MCLWCGIYGWWGSQGRNHLNAVGGLTACRPMSSFSAPKCWASLERRDHPPLLGGPGFFHVLAPAWYLSEQVV